MKKKKKYKGSYFFFLCLSGFMYKINLQAYISAPLCPALNCSLLQQIFFPAHLVNPNLSDYFIGEDIASDTSIFAIRLSIYYIYKITNSLNKTISYTAFRDIRYQTAFGKTLLKSRIVWYYPSFYAIYSHFLYKVSNCWRLPKVIYWRSSDNISIHSLL